MNDSLAPREALARQQNNFLASIFVLRAGEPSRGLAAYRANAHAHAERALGAAYPVVAQLLGDEDFSYLARDFWHQHPPWCGDSAQWGDQLPSFLAASIQLTDTPYLADLAHIEWALHTCASAGDLAQDIASFAALLQHEPELSTFLTAPGARILPSVYPAAAIALAHKGQSDIEGAAALLHAGIAQTALVWRQGFAPRLRIVHEAELAFICAVCAQKSLAQALSVAHASFDLSNWLTINVQNGLLLGMTTHTTSSSYRSA